MTAARWAAMSFTALFFMHLLDYMDRWILAGVLTKLQPDLGITNAQAGSLNFYFLITFSLISPLMGYAGDRTRRTRLLAAGVGLWSLATVGTGLSQNYFQLCLARSILGIGEATYGVIAPTILMDLFTRDKRARIMAAYYLAMPLGFAAGVITGSMVAEHTEGWFEGTFLAPYAGWRLAFFLVGIPGLFAAFLALILPEPIRGMSEGIDLERVKAHEQARPSLADYKDLMVNSSYTYVVFGLAAYTFAFGGLAFWLPSYLERVKGFSSGDAGLIVGATVFFASIIGMMGGGYLADRLSKVSSRALFLIPGTSMLLAIPFILIGLYSQTAWIIIGALFLAETLLLANTGPCHAIISNVVQPNMRATAYAVMILLIHMLGDVWSPWLMGLVADYTGHPEVMQTFVGDLLISINAIPTEGSNLTAGMLVVVPAISLGGMVLLAGARHLPREMALMLAKLKAVPEGSH